MRRLLATLLTVNLVLLSHTADACGDKLLILGRPLRMNDRPAAVLAYAPIGSPLESVLNGPQFAAAMTKSKHRLRVVQIPELLVRILNTQQFDVILISSMDASALRARLATTSSPAVVVAVVDSNSRDALKNAEKEYGVAMKGMAKSGDYLSAIGRAVDLHDRRVQAAMREKKNQRKSL